MASSAAAAEAPADPVRLLAPTFTWKTSQHDALCLAFSADGTQLAVGSSDGQIRIYRTDKPTSEPIHVLIPKTGEAPTMPITAMRFMPNAAASNVLVATYASGMIRHWHVSSGAVLHEQLEGMHPAGSSLGLPAAAPSAPPSSARGRSPSRSPKVGRSLALAPLVSLMALDVALDGARYVTGGTNAELSVYDAATHTRLRGLGLSPDMGGQVVASATRHTSRVFAVKCHPTDPNALFSAGWDSTVQIWDLRESRPVHHMSGPFVCGESVDVNVAQNRLLIGSYRENENLQIYDVRTCKLLNTLTKKAEGSWVYGCSYVKSDASRIVTCGSKSAALRVVDAATGNAVARFDAEGTLYAHAQAPAGGAVATGGVGGDVSLFNGLPWAAALLAK